MDDVLLSEWLDDFSFMSFIGSSQDDDLIVFSNWKRSDSVFFSKIFRKSCRHNCVSDVRRSGEVSFSRFSSAASNFDVSLHVEYTYGYYNIFMVEKLNKYPFLLIPKQYWIILIT